MKWFLGRDRIEKYQEGLVGIHETPRGISMAYAKYNGSVAANITAYKHIATVDPLSRKSAIAEFVSANSLAGVRCSYVLFPTDYTLSLVEAPNVAKEEVPSAMRWIIKDLINFPIQEAVIDTFELPFIRSKDNAKLVYAVIMRKSILNKVQDLIAGSGLFLRYVDIPELALRNIACRQPKSAQGFAFVQLYFNGGRVMIIRGEEICLTRLIEFKFDPFDSNNRIDKRILDVLALEIQRSFDYLNSTFHQNIPNVVVLAPMAFDKEMIKQSLSENLGMELDSLNLMDCLTFENPISDSEQAHCLLAIGATLRGTAELHETKH